MAQRLLVHLDQEDDEDSRPTLEDCAASRNAREYYRNVLRFVVAISILSSRNITPNELEFAQRLLERLATSFTEMNVHLSPTFHYSMHTAPFVLKYGSMYNTWCYPFERANLQLQTTNHNGHGLGVLESTFARGYLKKTGSFHIVSIQNLSLVKFTKVHITAQANAGHSATYIRRRVDNCSALQSASAWSRIRTSARNANCNISRGGKLSGAR